MSEVTNMRPITGKLLAALMIALLSSCQRPGQAPRPCPGAPELAVATAAPSIASARAPAIVAAISLIRMADLLSLPRPARRGPRHTERGQPGDASTGFPLEGIGRKGTT